MAQITPEPLSSQPSNQALAPDITQLAQDHQFGPFLRFFPTDRGSLRNSTILAVFILLFITILTILDILNKTGILIDLMVFISTGLFLVRALSSRDRVVYLFQNGIIYKKGARYESMHWQLIKKLKLRKRFLTDPASFQIYTTDGRREAFTYFESPEELYSSIERGQQYSQRSQEQ